MFYYVFSCFRHSHKFQHAFIERWLSRCTCLAPKEFKKLSSPWLKKVVHHWFICSLTNSYVPLQWCLSMMALTQDCHPLKGSDFRPLSISSIISYIVEKIVALRYFYPFITQPSSCWILHSSLIFARPSPLPKYCSPVL